MRVVPYPRVEAVVRTELVKFANKEHSDLDRNSQPVKTRL